MTRPHLDWEYCPLSTLAFLCFLTADSCGLFTATSAFYSLEAAGAAAGSGSGDWTRALPDASGCWDSTSGGFEPMLFCGEAAVTKSASLEEEKCCLDVNMQESTLQTGG